MLLVVNPLTIDASLINVTIDAKICEKIGSLSAYHPLQFICKLPIYGKHSFTELYDYVCGVNASTQNFVGVNSCSSARLTYTGIYIILSCSVVSLFFGVFGLIFHGKLVHKLYAEGEWKHNWWHRVWSLKAACSILYTCGVIGYGFCSLKMGNILDFMDDPVSKVVLSSDTSLSIGYNDAFWVYLTGVLVIWASTLFVIVGGPNEAHDELRDLERLEKKMLLQKNYTTTKYDGDYVDVEGNYNNLSDEEEQKKKKKKKKKDQN